MMMISRWTRLFYNKNKIWFIHIANQVDCILKNKLKFNERTHISRYFLLLYAYNIIRNIFLPNTTDPADVIRKPLCTPFSLILPVIFFGEEHNIEDALWDLFLNNFSPSYFVYVLLLEEKTLLKRFISYSLFYWVDMKNKSFEIFKVKMKMRESLSFIFLLRSFIVIASDRTPFSHITSWYLYKHTFVDLP